MWWMVVACSAPPTTGDDAPAPTTTTGTTTESGDPTSPVSSPVFEFAGGVPTNLLAISVDTTRRDAIGRYAKGPSDTPFLDELLEQSVVLDNHHSCSNWTGPSMVCATSGLSSVEAEALRGSAARDRLPTVARLLGERGYASRLTSANPYFFGRRDAIGFDEVIELPEIDPGRAERVAQRFLGQLDELTAPRWYAHAHFFDPHEPYCAPEAYRKDKAKLPAIAWEVCTELDAATEALWPKGDAGLQAAVVANVAFEYQAEMRYWDDELRKLWQELEARGYLDDTLVVFFTDHGEQRYERGNYGHGRELFAEENRAVAAFWAKNLSASVIQKPTVHQDLATTLFDLYGVSPQRTGSGRTLDQVSPDRVLEFASGGITNFSTVAVVLGGTQLTLGYEDERSFHDLTTDPATLTNLYDPHRPDVARAWQAMLPFLDEVDAAFPNWVPHSRNP